MINHHKSGFILIEILAGLLIASIMIVGILDQMHMVLIKRQKSISDMDNSLLSRDIISSFDDKGWSGPGIWSGEVDNKSWILEASNFYLEEQSIQSNKQPNSDIISNVKLLLINFYIINKNIKKNILTTVRMYKENENK